MITVDTLNGIFGSPEEEPSKKITSVTGDIHSILRICQSINTFRNTDFIYRMKYGEEYVKISKEFKFKYFSTVFEFLEKVNLETYINNFDFFNKKVGGKVIFSYLSLQEIFLLYEDFEKSHIIQQHIDTLTSLQVNRLLENVNFS